MQTVQLTSADAVEASRLTSIARRLSWLPTVGAVVSVASVLGAAWLHWRTTSTSDVEVQSWAADYIAAISYPVVGAFLVRHRPENPVGWVLSFASLLGVYVFCAEYAVLGILANPGSFPLTGVAAWVAIWGWLPQLVMPTLVPLLFPSGRLDAKPERYMAALIIVLVSLVWLARIFSPVTTDYSPQIANPIGIAGLDVLNWTVRICSILCFVVCAPLCAAMLVLRARRARGVERAQMQWLMVSGVLLVVSALSSLVISPEIGNVLWSASLVAVPLCIFVAVARHQLLDIELFLNRSIVLVVLSILIVTAYFLGVAAVSALDLSNRLAFALVALFALTAALVRAPVQRLTDKLLFGHRGDPYAVVSRVGGRLDLVAGPAEALNVMAVELREALRLPYVEISADGLESAVSGRPVDVAEEFPVDALGQRVGTLRVGHRHAREKFIDEERAAIVDVARRSGAFVQAAKLLSQVQASREDAVVAREDERRRLRRDLHDGVGPELAGIALRLDALVAKGGPDAEQLSAVRDKMREVVGDVRRVIDDLGPSVLDRLGLEEAIGQLAQNFASADIAVDVRIELEGVQLSAAVEAAIYRVVSEALNNAVRHGRPTRCAVRIDVVGADIRVIVEDDGTGMTKGVVRGVGLESMEARASELGGTLVVSSAADSGTTVSATFPRSQRQ